MIRTRLQVNAATLDTKIIFKKNFFGKESWKTKNLSVRVKNVFGNEDYVDLNLEAVFDDSELVDFDLSSSPMTKKYLESTKLSEEELIANLLKDDAFLNKKRQIRIVYQELCKLKSLDQFPAITVLEEKQYTDGSLTALVGISGYSAKLKINLSKKSVVIQATLKEQGEHLLATSINDVFFERVEKFFTKNQVNESLSSLRFSSKYKGQIFAGQFKSHI